MFIKIISILTLNFVVIVSFCQANCGSKEKTDTISTNIEKDGSTIKDIDTLKYSYTSTPTNIEVQETLSKVRGAIWEYWCLQKEGIVIFEAYSKEGEKSVTNFHVTTLGQGKWQIIVRTESKIRKQGGRSATNNITEYTAMAVDRIEVPKDGLVKRQIISQNIKRNSKSYRIRLKDAKETVLLEI